MPPGPAVVGPGELGIPPDAPVPVGTRIDLDPTTQRLAPDALFGGAPGRVLRLSATGMRALRELCDGPVTTPAGGTLGRRLIDAGLAHPRHTPLPAPPSVTVVVPVRDRALELERCLRSVGRDHPVLVVDDGSVDPAAVSAVCRRHGARCLRRPLAGGPAAARNTALARVDTELIAFVDSDCEPGPSWIDRLVGYLGDPLTVGVAPRIVALGQEASSLPGSPLDLGPRPAPVAPRGRVSYVPTAALLVRRAAFGDGFDESLRYGEDVDLVWRLLESGWRLRYEPSVEVTHREPRTVGGLLARRFRYGSSAGPLARRHPGNLAHVVLYPGPTGTVGALLARRPLVALACFAGTTAMLARRLERAGLPGTAVLGPSAAGVVQTWLGIGRWCGQFAAPVLVAFVAFPGGRSARRRWGRRAAALSLLLGPSLVEGPKRRSEAPFPLGALARYCAADLLYQAAYGAGVYAGCLRERVASPIVPSLAPAWRPTGTAPATVATAGRSVNRSARQPGPRDPPP